jgi:hypothetical protein
MTSKTKNPKIKSSLPIQLFNIGNAIDNLPDKKFRKALQKAWHKQAVKFSCRFLRGLEL